MEAQGFPHHLACAPICCRPQIEATRVSKERGMKYRIAAVTFVLVVALAGAVGAQIRPDFSGTWKLNADRSKFASEAPANVIVRFENDGRILHETLTTARSGFKSTTKLIYSLDGGEIVNHVGDEEIKATAKWDGETLVLEWKDQGGTSTRRFAMAKDGKSMTMEVRDSDPNIPAGDVVVLDKQ